MDAYGTRNGYELYCVDLGLHACSCKLWVICGYLVFMHKLISITLIKIRLSLLAFGLVRRGVKIPTLGTCNI